jgi:single-stranded-DNA-specific exonuclease
LSNKAIDELLKKILISRGLKTKEQRAEFLSDKPMLMQDPFLLSDMADGVEILHEAISSSATICIYGDYDCDGVTASVLLYSFIKRIIEETNSEATVITYIPKRIEEGYGLNENAVRKLAENSVDLIITVDCGSVSAKEVALATELGMEMIITDHHDLDKENIPDCPLINPKNEKTNYPFKGLSGCGVAFKLAQAYQKTYGDDALRKFNNSMLDLVAISIIADVCPVLDENRTMLKYGLRILKSGRRQAISLLLRAVDFNEKNLTERQLGFIIGPHINAVGRVANPSLAFQFLATANTDKLPEIIQQVIKCNDTRKELQKACFDFCQKTYEEEQKDKPIIIINARTAHEGIIGIVAGRMKETYSKPCIILTENSENNTLKASCRSQGQLDIIALLRKHKDLFVKLGGHPMAAGFTIEAGSFDELSGLLVADVNTMLKKKKGLFLENEVIDIDFSKPDIELSLDLAEAISMLAPFGTKNLKPRVQLSDKPEAVKFMGAEKNHARFKISGKPCILFSKADKYKEQLEGSEAISIVGTLDINEFNGKRTPQILVERIE